MDQEIELRFGTPSPVPFQDARTGRNVYVKAAGNAMVLIEDTEKYHDRGEVHRFGGLTASQAIMEAISEQSGKADALNLQVCRKDIAKSFTEKMKGSGLKILAVDLLSIGPDQESVEMLKRAALSAPMTQDVSLTSDQVAAAMAQAQALKAAAQAQPVAASAAQAQPVAASAAAAGAQAAAPMYPKFCMYCGAPAGTKFCARCGAKLVQ